MDLHIAGSGGFWLFFDRAGRSEYVFVCLRGTWYQHIENGCKYYYCITSTYSSPLVTCDRHEEMGISSVPEMRCDILDISSADFRGANKWCAAAIGLATVPVYGYDRIDYGRLPYKK
ncbi:hypothetical protein PILCRDRAFT_728094 [Piloderma croceum F 1598]|uniref:Uncharacterized protein n=1 Tax=Piloderma croceum (strain F 1598) TaxID=765440 RepID=A0A0C3ELG9_PILCF|nr:hypothetical protein PILCRDRAFT_728094 [Piloderma croceum F 1598]